MYFEIIMNKPKGAIKSPQGGNSAEVNNWIEIRKPETSSSGQQDSIPVTSKGSDTCPDQALGDNHTQAGDAAPSSQDDTYQTDKSQLTSPSNRSTKGTGTDKSLGCGGGDAKKIFFGNDASIVESPPTPNVTRSEPIGGVAFNDASKNLGTSVNKENQSENQQPRRVTFSDSSLFLQAVLEVEGNKGKVEDKASVDEASPKDSKCTSPLFVELSDLENGIKKHKHLGRLHSSQPTKSKMLETKLQQKMRVAFYDFEAKRATEDWKFRKSVEALDLDYQRKLMKLVDKHNASNKKLHDKFMKKVDKTQKMAKKAALKGVLNEGSCLHVSQSVCNFKIKKF